MSTRADNNRWRKDGSVSFSGGVDGSRQPSDIDRNQCAFAVNTTFRNGKAAPRPGLKKHALTFDTGIETPFKSGMFQHADFFDGNGLASLMMVCGGRVFKIDAKSMKVTELTPGADGSTTTTADFTIPTAPGTTTVQVSDTSDMSALSGITIGGYPLALISIDSPGQITVANELSDNDGTVVADPATVIFKTLNRNSASLPIGWSVQAENYWIYQDNQSLPIIYNGTTSRRAVPSKNEVPIGNVMCYAAGRISVALQDRQSFRVGDIVFGDSGTVANGYKDAILRFTENSYLNEGGDFIARVFGAPSNSGPIYSMKATAQGDTSLGQGPMMVGTPFAVFSVNLPFDRTTWKLLSYPIQTVNPVLGPLSQRSTVLVNADQYYRALDGFRTFIVAQRQFNGSWGNTPISSELGDLLEYDSNDLLEHGSAVLFDNRYLATISPVKTEHGVYHRGLISLDFNLISTMRRKDPPAWEGVWTGVKILQIVTGLVDKIPRCFLFVLSPDNEIELWELDPSKRDDEGDTPIQWSGDLCSYNCGDSDGFKKLETGRIIVSDIWGDVTIAVKYRTDLSPCWQTWDTVTICGKNKDCATPECDGPHTYRDQERTPVKLHMPPDAFDPITGLKYRTGYEFQPRLEITGACSVRQVRIYCLDEPEALGRDRDAT